MKVKHTLVAFALAAACGLPLASAASGRLQPLGENRIVGTWHVSVTLASCAGGPAHSFIALNTFHAGGTLTSTDNTPQPGNGPAQGIWEYRGANRYSAHFQFYRFLHDGTWDGLQDIYQETTVDWRGNAFTSSIHAIALNKDGSVRGEVCGTSQGVRVPIDSNP